MEVGQSEAKIFQLIRRQVELDRLEQEEQRKRWEEFLGNAKK